MSKTQGVLAGLLLELWTETLQALVDREKGQRRETKVDYKDYNRRCVVRREKEEDMVR